MALVTVTRFEEFAHVRVDSPPAIVLTAEARAQLMAALDEVERSDAAGLLMMAARGGFLVDPDASAFETATVPPDLRELVARLEGLGKLTFAVCEGPTFGAALELAMACDLRVAGPAATFGLPEVTVGRLAPAGGVQRLVRLIGPERALPIVALGKLLSAHEARQAGLVDAVPEPEDLLSTALTLARAALSANARPERASRREAKLRETGEGPDLFAAFRDRNAKPLRGRVAAELNIQAVEAATSCAFGEARAVEARLLAAALESEQAPALRYAFLSRSQAQRIPDVPEDTRDIAVGRVGVVGAGTMGGGIAMACANAGLDVVLVDQAAAALDRGLATIRRNYAQTAARGGLGEAEVASHLDRIVGAVGLAALTDVDLVIEAAFERMDVKQDIFRELDRICRPGAVLGTNTSGLDINAIAGVTRRPEAVIGLHFASPAHVTRGVEVIRGDRTSREVVATGMRFAKRLGKLPVLVGVTPGFVANRTMYPYRRAAIALVAEGATPWEVDQAVYDFGFPMGPFAMHDLAGLDVGWNPDDASGDILRDRLCRAGRFGQKSMAGYYDYDEGRTPTPFDVVAQIVERFQQESGRAVRKISADEMVERLMFPIANEGARLLEEGKALRASDIDLIWRFGYGWPDYRGGPMYFADQKGLGHVIRSLEASAAPPDDEVSLLLRSAASTGEPLHCWGWRD
ncbi:MAG: 3-hydroxyacyl-CoA dehydrogenase [Caulobacterales bacterium]|nr:3-hydroxyacyl-CoA dehydrogenase [Caulobacterales bacterium]